MKNKLCSCTLAALLTFTLMFVMFPTTVSAANPTELWINGIDIISDADHTVELGNGSATYDPDTNTLTLDNAKIDYQQNGDTNYKGAILFDGDLNINLVGENTITSITCGIRGTSVGTLTITGDSLIVDATYYGIGIPIVDANIIIDGADIDIAAKGSGDYIGVGIQAGGVLSIVNGAYVDAIDVSHQSIIGNSGIEITDSTVYAQQYTDYYPVVVSDKDISISNSIVDIRTDSNQTVAIWAGNDLQYSNGNIVISNGSDVNVYAKSANAIYAMLGTISISNSSVKAEILSGGSPALCADFDIDIANSNVVVKSPETIGIWSSGGSVAIQDSIAQVTAHNEWPAIRGDNGGTTITGSWIEAFGDDVSPELNSSDSAIFLNNEGSVSGSLTLPGNVTVGKDMKLSIPTDSSIIVPNGITFTNHGQIELLGGSIENNGGTIVCDNHVGGTATCTSKAECDICGKEYGDFLAHELVKTEAKAPTCNEDGNKEYWTCNTCKKYFSDAEGMKEISLEDTVILSTGHKLNKIESLDPTVDAPGNITYWHCEICDKYFSDENG